MEEIEYIYKNYPSFNTIEQFNRVEELLNEDYGIRISTKEENGFIDIEYNNRMGEYKAKLLIEYFNQNKEFWQYFLQRKSKVVIGRKNNSKDDELFIRNYPNALNSQNILNQIFSSRQECSYLGFIAKKLSNPQEENLTLDEVSKVLKNGLLGFMVDKNNIDFFEYLDLLDGEFINLNYYYDIASVDFAFEKGNFDFLNTYMNLEDKEAKKVFQDKILFTLQDKYSIFLFRELLEGQVNLLRQYSEEKNDDFLEKNIQQLSTFFQNELFRVFRNFNIGCEPNKDKLKLSKDEILNLVLEFLSIIDETGTLKNEFIDNVANGRIILWDKSNAEQRNEFMSKLGNRCNIDNPECISFYNKDDLSRILLNIPLTYTLDDVCTIVHEFSHFHSDISSGKKAKNELVEEIPSIYFEQKVRQFLIEKGYSTSNFDANFRIVDSFLNLQRLLSIIEFMSIFQKNGYVSTNMIDELISSNKRKIAKGCASKGLSLEETENQFKRQGFWGDVVDIRKNILLNMNCLLLRQKRSIFTLTPYLLGTIISNNAIENGCSVEDMINLSTNLNNVTDIVDVMKMVGIDTNKYGLTSSKGVSK